MYVYIYMSLVLSHTRFPKNRFPLHSYPLSLHKMMRLVISPSRRYHLGREQQGFHHAITSTSTTTSQSKINWTLTWSLDKQLRKRNNEHEHKLPPSLPPSSPFYCSSASTATRTKTAKESMSTSTRKNILVPSFPHYYPNSSFSSSPMLPLHHILPSRRKVTCSKTPISTTTPLLSVIAQSGGALQIQTKSSLSPSPSSSQRSFKLARILGSNKHGRFQRKMNILNRRLHSSLSSHASCTSSLFSFSSSPPRFISTSSTRSYAAPGENCEDFFRISPEVRAALMENVPVVALESAIITHGMPYPDNIDTAFHLEAIIRKHVCTLPLHLFCFLYQYAI